MRRTPEQYRRSVAAVRHDRHTTIEEGIFDAAGEQVEARAAELGLALTHSVSGKRGVRQSHFGFYRDGHRVADYWPVTNTLRIGAQNRKAATVPEALEIVALFVGPTASTGPYGPRPKGKTRGRRYARPQGTADKPQRKQ